MINNQKCDSCHGTVRNVPGKRHTTDRLTAIHDDTCPGRHRRSPR